MTKRLTKDEFVSRARKLHGDKYDYSKVVYVNARNHVDIICKEHGDFLQTPSGHLKGYGCPICGNIKNKLGKKDMFIARANEIHKNKYDYSKVKYNRTDEKVEIICPIHGSFWQEPHAHLKGCGCYICSTEKRYKNTDDFVKRAKELYGELYDYSKTKYEHSLKKVIVTCHTHGDFLVSPANHLFGCGCPICNKSRGERLIFSYLSKMNIDFESQYVIQNENIFCENKCFKVDFYIPSRNIVIEYNGIQHYKEIGFFGGDKVFEKQQERDMALRQYCKEHNIRLIEIPYWENNNIENVLDGEMGIIKNKVKS